MMPHDDYPPEDAPRSDSLRVTDGNDDPGRPFTWTCPWCGISEDHETPGTALGPFVLHPSCHEDLVDQMEADEIETLIQQAEAARAAGDGP
jgi:hypothetical protein